MTADLDRLELELRCLQGIVAIGLERRADEELFIQAVVIASNASVDFREQIHRVVDANIRDGSHLEIVVDALDASPGSSQSQ